MKPQAGLQHLFLALMLVCWGPSVQAFSAMDDNLITPNSIYSAGPFRLIRSEENYLYLKDENPAGLLDKIKFIPLNDDKSNYLTLGGEIRENYSAYANENWGQLSKTDSHLFHRLMLSGDTHFGSSQRVFVEFQSATSSFDSDPPIPINIDRFDVNQIFFDQKFHLADQRALTIRIGRQELDYGAERLIAVREGPNARMGFDGIKTVLNIGTSRLDAFWVLPVQTNPGILDNTSSFAKQLWALYWTQKIDESEDSNLGLELYYIGEHSDEVTYVSGSGSELRHSVGGRFYHPPSAQADFDIEGVEQFGSFADRSIQAWTLATDLGYTLPLNKSPRIALKTAAASGDSGGKTLGTFNPLYPRGAYLDLSTLMGPSNFISLNPYFNLHPRNEVSVTAGYNFLWRESTQDGLYNPGMGIVRSGEGTSAKYIGSELALTANWQVDKHFNFLGGYAHLYAGDFIKQTGPSKGADYFTLYGYFIF